MSESQACVSDLVIDRYLTAELSRDAADSLELHAASCSRCAARLARLRADTVSTRDMLPPLPGISHSRTPWVGMIAVAAGLLLAVFIGRAFLGKGDVDTSAREQLAQTRTKGRAHLTLYVRRNDRVRAFDGETLAGGDAIAFTYSSSVETHLAVFDVDDGEVTCLHPTLPSTVTAEAEAGADVEIDLAVTLDDSVSDESIVGVFCEEPQPIATLTEVLSSGSALPTSCSAEWIRLPKAGR